MCNHLLIIILLFCPVNNIGFHTTLKYHLSNVVAEQLSLIAESRRSTLAEIRFVFIRSISKLDWTVRLSNRKLLFRSSLCLFSILFDYLSLLQRLVFYGWFPMINFLCRH